MKTLIPILLLALALPASADVYKAKFGSKLRLDGDSSVHKWKAESRLIGGTFTKPADILREIGAKNRVRGAKIKCNSYGQETPFLKQLAKQNGGVYRATSAGGGKKGGKGRKAN